MKNPKGIFVFLHMVVFGLLAFSLGLVGRIGNTIWMLVVGFFLVIALIISGIFTDRYVKRYVRYKKDLHKNDSPLPDVSQRNALIFRTVFVMALPISSIVVLVCLLPEVNPEIQWIFCVVFCLSNILSFFLYFRYLTQEKNRHP